MHRLTRFAPPKNIVLSGLATLLAITVTSCTETESSDPEPPTTKENTVTEKPSALTAVKAHIEKLKADGKLDTSSPSWRVSLPKFPSVAFNGNTYHWSLKTNKGDIRLKLMPEVAPNHVANFLYLTELGFFDGLVFHRVIPGFMAQGGCPLGTGTGSPGYRFAGEHDPSVRHDRPGLLSMANAGPGTDGSQFFITFVPTPHLDGRHTIFGEVVEGQDTLKTLEQYGSSPTGRTSERLVIEEATISGE